MTFAKRMEAEGWVLLKGDQKDPRLSEIAPSGDAQYARGSVTLSLSNGTIYEGKHGQIGYFDEPGLILNAIVVDKKCRHQGHGRRAMQSLISACHAQDEEIRLKLEAGYIGRGFVDEDKDMSASSLVGWYQGLGFVLDPDSSKCMTYRRAEAPTSYDFGIERDNEPEWEEMRVDSIAAWILKRLPQNLMATCVRTLANAYNKHGEEFGSSPDPVTFLRYEQNNLLYECHVFESEDEHRNMDGAIVCGNIFVLGKNITIAHDFIRIPEISESAVIGLKGKPAQSVVDIEPLRDRIIEDVTNEQQTKIKTTSDREITCTVVLNEKKRQLWTELFPNWV